MGKPTVHMGQNWMAWLWPSMSRGNHQGMTIVVTGSRLADPGHPAARSDKGALGARARRSNSVLGTGEYRGSPEFVGDGGVVLVKGIIDMNLDSRSRRSSH
jgi:hypothetical protein